MSFILDALRKSEHERQDRLTPGIADARQRRAGGGRAPWLLLLSLLLAANAVLVAWLLLRDAGGSGPQTVALPVPPAGQPAPLGDLKPLPEASETLREPAPAAPALKADGPAAGAGATAAPRVTAEQIPPSPAAGETPAPPAADSGEVLPSLQQLVLGGLLELPPLRIDMHVYSDDPGRRFVFVNMRKYREGERLREGPLLERITADGVVLNHQGRRFTLARE
ncbi:MAG: hypothetical protein D6727_04545 [Gammaproteobacteria bacterium]|nr:MAG: hypothetical protein D6727_04545 [Gammaproteobacteria bacterium]